MILSLLKTEKRVTLDRIVEMTHLSNGRLLGTIEKLIEDGIVEGAGSGKARFYILSEKEYKDSSRNVPYMRQTGIDRVSYPEMIIEKVRIQNGIITKQDVAELLKLPPEQAYSEIRKLVEAGMMYRYCGGRYTKYKLR